LKEHDEIVKEFPDEKNFISIYKKLCKNPEKFPFIQVKNSSFNKSTTEYSDTGFDNANSPRSNNVLNNNVNNGLINNNNNPNISYNESKGPSPQQGANFTNYLSLMNCLKQNPVNSLVNQAWTNQVLSSMYMYNNQLMNAYVANYMRSSYNFKLDSAFNMVKKASLV